MNFLILYNPFISEIVIYPKIIDFQYIIADKRLVKFHQRVANAGLHRVFDEDELLREQQLELLLGDVVLEFGDVVEHVLQRVVELLHHDAEVALGVDVIVADLLDVRVLAVDGLLRALRLHREVEVAHRLLRGPDLRKVVFDQFVHQDLALVHVMFLHMHHVARV